MYNQLHVNKWSGLKTWLFGMQNTWLGSFNPLKEVLSINALHACIYIYIRQLSSFRMPTLWFINLMVATCHIQYTFLSLLLGPGLSLKMGSVCLLLFFSWGWLPVLRWLISFMSSHALFNGRLDCCCRPSLFSLEKETPSRGSTFTCAPLFSGLKLWQNFYRVDCSDKETGRTQRNRSASMWYV